MLYKPSEKELQLERYCKKKGGGGETTDSAYSGQTTQVKKRFASVYFTSVSVLLALTAEAR